jgi:hypothetical protein
MHPSAATYHAYRTLTPFQGGLWGCNVLSGLGPHLPVREGFGVVICTIAPDPAPLSRRASALPHIP